MRSDVIAHELDSRVGREVLNPRVVEAIEHRRLRNLRLRRRPQEGRLGASADRDIRPTRRPAHGVGQGGANRRLPTHGRDAEQLARRLREEVGKAHCVIDVTADVGVEQHLHAMELSHRSLQLCPCYTTSKLQRTSWTYWS